MQFLNPIRTLQLNLVILVKLAKMRVKMMLKKRRRNQKLTSLLLCILMMSSNLKKLKVLRAFAKVSVVKVKRILKALLRQLGVRAQTRAAPRTATSLAQDDFRQLLQLEVSME